MPSPVPPGEEPASKPTETDATPPNPGAALTLNVSEMEIGTALVFAHFLEGGKTCYHRCGLPDGL